MSGRPPTWVRLGAGEAVTEFDAGSRFEGLRIVPRARGSDSSCFPRCLGRVTATKPVLVGGCHGRGRRAGAACRAGSRAGSWQGGVGSVCAGAARVQTGPADAGGADLPDHDRGTTADGGLVSL